MPTPKISPDPVKHCRASGWPRPSRKPADSHFELFESWKPSAVPRVLCDTKRQTPVFTRFSTVVGSPGSVDTVRDVMPDLGGLIAKAQVDKGAPERCFHYIARRSRRSGDVDLVPGRGVDPEGREGLSPASRCGG